MSREFLTCVGGVWRKEIWNDPRVYPDRSGGRMTLDELRVEAMKHSSRGWFKLNDPIAYMALLRYRGEMDALFPVAKRPLRVLDEQSLRVEAAKYKSRTEFMEQDSDAYNAALKLELMDDLGFGPPKGGFNKMLPSLLYVTNVILKNGEVATMIGVTNKHPYARFTLKALSLISNRSAYRFGTGAEAMKAEKHLKTLFLPHAIAWGLSPIGDKPGTGGEIISGVTVETVTEALRTYCGELPQCEFW